MSKFASSVAVKQQRKMYTYYNRANEIIRDEGMYASYERGSK